MMGVCAALARRNVFPDIANSDEDTYGPNDSRFEDLISSDDGGYVGSEMDQDNDGVAFDKEFPLPDWNGEEPVLPRLKTVILVCDKRFRSLNARIKSYWAYRMPRGHAPLILKCLKARSMTGLRMETVMVLDSDCTASDVADMTQTFVGEVNLFDYVRGEEGCQCRSSCYREVLDSEV